MPLLFFFLFLTRALPIPCYGLEKLDKNHYGKHPGTDKQYPLKER
jgi:hypothetical protein